MPTHAIVTPGQPEEVAVYKLKTVLTDAQIKALPTTGITLVPAPGAGKIIQVISAICEANFAGGAYTHDAGSSWILTAGIFYASGPIDGSFLGSADSLIIPFPVPYANVDETLSFTTTVSNYNNSGIKSQVENQPLKIKDDYTGVANYTGGHADNTLSVTVQYSIVDL